MDIFAPPWTTPPPSHFIILTQYPHHNQSVSQPASHHEDQQHQPHRILDIHGMEWNRMTFIPTTGGKLCLGCDMQMKNELLSFTCPAPLAVSCKWDDAKVEPTASSAAFGLKGHFPIQWVEDESNNVVANESFPRFHRKGFLAKLYQEFC